MNLKRIGSSNSVGGFFVAKGYLRGASFEGKLTINLGDLTPRRRSELVLSLKRGYSRGTTANEQYSFYALVCEKFGLTHTRISSGQYNFIPIPDNEGGGAFRTRVLDVMEPMFRLTDQTFDRRAAEGRHGWYGWGETNVRGQRMLRIIKPRAIGMNVLAKGLKKFIPEPPLQALCDAIDFVEGGGEIIIEFKEGAKYAAQKPTD